MRRSGKVLLIATREFNEKSRSRSWWYVGTTLFLLVASLFMAGLAPWWQVRLVGSVLGGLIMARAFILYHDFMHGCVKSMWEASTAGRKTRYYQSVSCGCGHRRCG